MAAGLQFDFNYAFSKSIDVGSNAERVNGFESSGVGFQQPGHQCVSLPTCGAPRPISTPPTSSMQTGFGIFLMDTAATLGSKGSGFMNGVFGGWGLNGLARWTSGFPFSVEAGAGYSTDFELEGSSILTGSKPKTGVFNTVNGSPAFSRIRRASDASAWRLRQRPNSFRATLPGEAGQRNNFRGPGFFGHRSRSLKIWNLSEGKTLRFAWEVFNATNSVRFDAAGSLIGESLFNITGFGLYNTELTTRASCSTRSALPSSIQRRNEKGRPTPSLLLNQNSRRC